MKMRYGNSFIVGVIVSFLLLSMKVSAITPVIKQVTLTPFTTLVIDIVPDLGTRFVFPFVLDEQDEFVPFTLNITNPVFVTSREEGRNSFVITAPPPVKGGKIKRYYSNMFVSVAGYNISVVLRTSADLTMHVSDIVFNLSDEKREDLIQQAVDQNIKSIKKEYAIKESALEGRAYDLMLKKVGQLAMQRPKKKNIKEEFILEDDSGERIVFFLDDVTTYGEFHLFHYELTNHFRDTVFVNDAALFLIDKNGFEKKQRTFNNVRARVEVGGSVSGVIVSDNKRIIEGEGLRLSVMTDKGLLEVKW